MLMFVVDVGVMEDDYNTMLYDKVNMDIDMGLGVSLVEDIMMNIVDVSHVDCSNAFKTTKVAILFI